MCRLLGVVAGAPAPIADQLPGSLGRFIALSDEHSHGWGVAYRDAHGSVRVDKEPVQAATSATFHDLVARTVSDAALLHLRQASPGMPLVPQNTHPWLADGNAFAHNGYAWPNDALDTTMAAVDAPPVTGGTDSERYLSLVRAAMRDRPVPDALRDAASWITERASMTSLNCLFLTPDALYAMAWWHGPTIRAQPDGETERDYRLWYQEADGRVTVASAGIPAMAAEWHELPDRCVLEIRRGDLATSVHGPA